MSLIIPIIVLSCTCVRSFQNRTDVDSARQQMYLQRNTLHHELQLPDGYGKLTTTKFNSIGLVII